MSKCKVILFEHKYHDELLLPQTLDLLDNDVEVHLVCSKKIASNRSLDQVRDRVHWVTYDAANSLLTKAKMLWQLPRYANLHHIDAIIVNTLDSNFTRSLLTRLKFLRRAAFVHNADKFIGGGIFEKNILATDKIFTLTDYISLYLNNRGVDATAVNLTNFGKTNRHSEAATPATKKPIHVVIPGQIDFTRRDYLSLLTIEKLASNVKFILLGNASKNDGPTLIESIRNKNLESHFRWFDQFVEHDQFMHHIFTASYIMPLIHPNCDSYEHYKTCKASAAFMWAKAFSIPMLMEQGFDSLQEYKALSQYYSLECLGQTIEHLSEPSQIRSTASINSGSIANEILAMVETTRSRV